MRSIVLVCAVLVLAAGAAALPAAGRDVPFSFPGLDTLEWCEYNANGGGNTTKGLLAGFGVKLTPDHYPAVVIGAYDRIFRLNTDSAQFMLVDDDGPSGAPLSSMGKRDTLVADYSSQFYFHWLPAPACTVRDGSFYLFCLGNYKGGEYSLNWLNDGTTNAPTGTYWRRDSLGEYSQITLGGDLQLAAVVEYHDVALESLCGLPEDDTVYIDSSYSLVAWCHEQAGFAEDRVPIVIQVGTAQFDTALGRAAPGDTGSARFPAWQARVPAGTYDCTCYALLGSDTHLADDTVRFQLVVANPPSGQAESGPRRTNQPLLRIQPNPTVARIVQATVCSAEPGYAKLAVHDVAGRVVARAVVPGAGEQTVRLNLAGLSSGLYLVTCYTACRSETRLLVLK